MSENRFRIVIEADNKGRPVLKEAVGDLKTLESQANKSGKGVSRVFASMSNAGSSLRSNMFGLKSAIVGMIAAFSLSKMLGIADTYTMLNGRLKLVTEGAEQLERVEGKLYETSLKTHQGFEQTATLYTGLARATKELHTSEADLLFITENLNKAAVVSGASREATGNSLRQMNQALQGGVVRAEEYNSILENTPRVLQGVAEGLGLTMGQLRNEMLEGKLSAERFLNGFKNGASGINAEFEKLPTTVSQALTDLNTVFESIVDGANDSSGSTNKIATEIINVSHTVDENRNGIISLFTKILELSGRIISTMANIGQSFESWEAVSSGKLSFFEFATMNAKDLDEWLDRDNQGLVEIENTLQKLADKRKDVAESFAFTSDARIAKQEELKAINDQIAALRNLRKGKEEAYAALPGIKGKGFKDSWQTVGENQKRLDYSPVPVPDKNATSILDQYDKLDAAMNKYFKSLDAVAKKEAERTEKIREAAKATDLKILAMNGIEDAKTIPLDSWQKNLELREEYQKESLKKMEENEESFVDKAKDAFTGWAASFSGSLNDMFWSADTNFGNIAESFAKMATQMMFQYQIMEPMMKSISGFDWGGLAIDFFSNFASGFGGSSIGGSSTPTSGSGRVSHYHYGGIAGSEPSFYKAIPRFHDGLMPDEFPAILQKGEGVFTKGQMKALGQSGGGVTVNIINNSDSQASVQESQDKGGGFSLDIIIDKVEKGISSNVATGRGTISRTFEKTYGLSRAAGAYS